MSFTIPVTLATTLLLSPPVGPQPSSPELALEVNGETGRNGAPSPWTIVGNAGWGAPGAWDQEIQGPTFSAQFLRREGPRFELGFEVTGFLGMPHERRSVREHSFGRTESFIVRKEQHWGVLSRVNYLLGEEGVRPYLSGGVGVAWLRRQSDRSWRTVAPDGTVQESSRSHDSGGPALANLLAAGVEIPLGDRLRLRPEVSVLTSFPGFLLKPQLTASVVWPLGGQPVPMPPPARTGRPRGDHGAASAAPQAEDRTAPAEGDDPAAEIHRADGRKRTDVRDAQALPWALRDAVREVAREVAEQPTEQPPDDAWRPVLALPAGKLVDVELFPEFHAFNPDGALQRPKGGKLFGTVVEVNRDGIRLDVEKEPHEGRWFVSRDAIRHVETGVIAHDPPWEGIGAGLGVGIAFPALMFAGDDFDRRGVAYMGLMLGVPLAVLGGIMDYRKPSFRPTSTVYVGQR